MNTTLVKKEEPKPAVEPTKAPVAEVSDPIKKAIAATLKKHAKQEPTSSLSLSTALQGTELSTVATQAMLAKKLTDTLIGKEYKPS